MKLMAMKGYSRAGASPLDAGHSLLEGPYFSAENTVSIFLALRTE